MYDQEQERAIALMKRGATPRAIEIMLAARKEDVIVVCAERGITDQDVDFLIERWGVRAFEALGDGE